MRNLKRVLSLALALVMVLGMMVIGSSAATYTDAADIEYDEAVAVMSGLEVLSGYNGTFNPKGELTRDQAAKIICYMLMGKTNADKLVGTGKFADTTGWSAGYVEYCANLGIVAGYGDGNFGPGDDLLGIQFAKMLLVALGYNADIEGYTGNDWATNISVAAINAGLDIDGVSLDATLTREQAAQMAFQALEAQRVRYSGGTQVELPGGTSVTVGATRYDNQGTFAAKYFPELRDYKNTTDPKFGRPGTNWSFDKNDVSTKDDVFVADEPILTYTAKVAKVDGIKKALKGYNDADAKAAAIQAATGNGVTVEVYADDAKNISFISYTEVVDTVKKVVAADEKKGIEKTYVELKNTNLTFETEDFAKNDVVLYVVGNVSGEIESMVKAEQVVGKVTAYTADTVTIDGVKYNLHQGVSAPADFTGTYTFTLDTLGNVISTGIKNTAASTDFVYVNKVQYKNTTSDLLATAAQAAKAEIVAIDGTKSVVDLAIAKENNKYYVTAPAADGTVAKEELATGDETIGAWFAYTVEDGAYTLEAISADYATVVSGDVTLAKGSTQAIEGKYTTETTTVTLVDSKNVATSWTGYAKTATAVEGDAGEILITYAKNSSTIAAIYAVAQAPKAESVTYAYAVKEGNTVAKGAEWTFAIEGAQETYTISGTEPTAGGVYKLTKQTNGTYTVEAVSYTVADAQVTLVTGKQFVAGGSIYTLADNAGVYNVDKDVANVIGEADTLEKDDIVSMILNGEGKVVAAWIVDLYEEA